MAQHYRPTIQRLNHHPPDPTTRTPTGKAGQTSGPYTPPPATIKINHSTHQHGVYRWNQVKAAAGKLLRTDKVRADTTDARGEFIILSMAAKNTSNEPRSYFAENQQLFDSAVGTTQRTPWRTCR